jgi:hypothetical protein
LVTFSAPFSPVREENWLQNALRTRHCLSVASLTSLAFWSQFLAKGRPCGNSFCVLFLFAQKKYVPRAQRTSTKEKHITDVAHCGQ